MTSDCSPAKSQLLVGQHIADRTHHDQLIITMETEMLKTFKHGVMVELLRRVNICNICGAVVTHNPSLLLTPRLLWIM
ncbi:hypothetical protein INR49_010308 [Caranx melampygus]|nr:hypothetical protein INR49_010308 [Caranx melampygus]